MKLKELGFELCSSDETFELWRNPLDNDTTHYQELFFTTDYGGKWTCGEASWNEFILHKNETWEAQQAPEHRNYKWSARFGSWVNRQMVITEEIATAIAEHIHELERQRLSKKLDENQMAFDF
jgi:hypothetical protein